MLEHANISIALIDYRDVKKIFKDDKAKGEVYWVLILIFFFTSRAGEVICSRTSFYWNCNWEIIWNSGVDRGDLKMSGL